MLRRGFLKAILGLLAIPFLRPKEVASFSDLVRCTHLPFGCDAEEVGDFLSEKKLIVQKILVSSSKRETTRFEFVCVDLQHERHSVTVDLPFIEGMEIHMFRSRIKRGYRWLTRRGLPNLTLEGTGGKVSENFASDVADFLFEAQDDRNIVDLNVVEDLF